VDGIDAAAAAYPETGAPTLDNIRVARHLWETRYGMTNWSRTLGSSGDVRLLTSAYKKDGSRFRLAVRNGQLYDWDEGDNGGSADASWQSVSGGGSLTDNRVQGVQYGEYFYFTDRSGALKRYTIAASSVAAAVAQPAKPAAAPTVKARHWRILEAWSGSAPFSWTESNGSDFDVESGTSAEPLPMSGNTAQFRARTTSAKGDTISRDVANEEIASHTIAFYVKHPRNKSSIVFEIGLNAAGETPFQIKPPRQNDWYVYFAPLDGQTSINYKRFRCLNSEETYSVYTGPLILPGRLQGKYYYRYSHYNPTTGAESSMSPISELLDLSINGISWKNETDKALKKAAAVVVVSDAGVDAATTKMRVYRSGGTGSLTKDSNGRTVWVLAGTIDDHSTTLSSSPSAGDNSFDVTTVGAIAADTWLVLEPGTADEDVVQVLSVASNTVTIRETLANSHTSGDAVRICFVDNVANESIDPTNRVEPERDDPPTGVQWIARSPQDRLVLCGYTDEDGTKRPSGVAFSNRVTPERPRDYEVFPADVDPITRQDINQGFRFNLEGGEAGEEIVWGGYFQGVLTLLTKTGVFRVHATGQYDFSGDSIQKVITGLGCMNGHCTVEVNGALYWLAEGRRIVRWDGQGAPEIVSALKITRTLEAAPAAYLGNWFAVAHTKRDGAYYCLFYTPSGATTNTKGLQLNTDSGAWEPVSYAESDGTAVPWSCAHVPSGSTDTRALYAAIPSGTYSGRIYILDDSTATDDGGAVIRIAFSTPRIPLRWVAQVERFFARLAAVSDSSTWTVTTGGSQYGDQSQNYTVSFSGSGDKEFQQRCHHRTLKGRWAQISVTASVSNRPALRDLLLHVIPVRDRQV